MAKAKPVVLLILDGWGYRAESEDNAIALAELPAWRRLLAECPQADDATRLRVLFAQAYNRPPTPAELDACRATLAELKAFHADKPADSSDPGPWTDLCHALLNANEFLYLP